ncbi:MAG: ribosomal protein S18-alanine N-acetyltransferase [Armatimonadetes bacterium]|nr:ribosomal protein S18-alanine N-acetyltransferase [Armatimonadota bacterium]
MALVASIRPMHYEHVDAVVAIDQASYPTPWTDQAYRTELRNRSAVYLVAEGWDGRVLGYAGMWIVADEMHVTTVAVDPGLRRMGIARRLLIALCREGMERGAGRMTLEVRSRNSAAIALYEQLGFERQGRRRGYYQDTGDDAIIMWQDDALSIADRPEGDVR